MPEILTELTAAAVAVYRQRTTDGAASPDLMERLFLSSDCVLRSVQRQGFLRVGLETATQAFSALVLEDPDFAPISPKAGELDPFIIHPAGGFRASASQIIASLFANAFVQLYLSSEPLSEGAYVRQVLDNLEELRRATRGEPIRVNRIAGIAGVSIADGTQLMTPWGTLRKAPAADPNDVLISPWDVQTTCILNEPLLIPVSFDRAANPTTRIEAPNARSSNVHVLLPLSFSLASSDASAPVAPIFTWSTTLMPFSLGFGFEYGHHMLAPRFRETIDVTQIASDVEEWARRVQQCHSASIDVAAQRLVSACAHRVDPSDALIDAVMVWENLVGTSTETTFRVTAALAKSLESETSKRREMRRTLGKVYDIRSKVVHGVAIDAGDVSSAAKRATEVAVLALRAAYLRGRPWIERTSTERADILILEDE